MDGKPGRTAGVEEQTVERAAVETVDQGVFVRRREVAQRALSGLVVGVVDATVPARQLAHLDSRGLEALDDDRIKSFDELILIDVVVVAIVCSRLEQSCPILISESHQLFENLFTIAHCARLP